MFLIEVVSLNFLARVRYLRPRPSDRDGLAELGTRVNILVLRG